MPMMGRYCKAYPITELRKFPGWQEQIEHLVPMESGIDGEPSPRTHLEDDDYLFLQENFVVTDGIFLDQHVIFDRVTPEWKAFCVEQLAFVVPDVD
jgi:hypothetical protein